MSVHNSFVNADRDGYASRMGGRPKVESVTIEDVAREASVSRQTVSRVINGRPNVKPAVRDRVRLAIDRLGYVPNLSARRMAGGRSYSIVLIVDRERTLDHWRDGRGNAWIDQMLLGGMTECERAGYRLMIELVETNDATALHRLNAIVRALRPDGVILGPPHCYNSRLADLLAEHSIACARVPRSGGQRCVDVDMDEEGAAAAATDHLLGLGHQTIAYLAGQPGDGHGVRRIEGFRKAAAAGGLDEKRALVCRIEQSFDVASTTLERLLDSEVPPTAVIADNAEMALAALHVAKQRALEVPSRLAVVSFEDTPGVRFSAPPLTAIRWPVAAMAAKACAQLIALSRGENGLGAFELPFELVVRESSSPRARP